jgi:membrane protein insertase Oxa1/YidC/SpoIIIJ
MTTLSRTPENRATSATIVNVFGHFGNIMSPYFFPTTDAPRYLIAMLCMASMAVLTVVRALSTKFVVKRESKKLKVAAEETGMMYNPYTL